MYINKIEAWCAGSKLSGLKNWSRPTISDIIAVWNQEKHTTSIIVVSCGANETELRDHLQSIGFKKMRNFINYGHGSKPTWLMGYQIPKKIWRQTTGYSGKGTWTRT